MPATAVCALWVRNDCFNRRLNVIHREGDLVPKRAVSAARKTHAKNGRENNNARAE